MNDVGLTAIDPQRDPRLRCVYQLAGACAYEAGHAQQVTRLAACLFDDLRDLHGLGDEERFYLAAAGLLHDIGWVEGQKGHHKTALRYIMTSTVLPWDDRLRCVIGSIARYHRKALPKLKHDHYAALNANDRDVVKKLAALLRLADGMDRSHGRVVRQVHGAVTADRVVVSIEADARAAAERAITREKADLFDKVYHLPLDLHWNTIVL